MAADHLYTCTVNSRSSFWRYLWHSWFREIGETLLIVLLVTTFLLSQVGVSGESMHPSLQNGEHVLVSKWDAWKVQLGLSKWQSGDVVILKPPAGSPNYTKSYPLLGIPFHPYFIKRIIGTPGDVVSLQGGRLFINGADINESFITDQLVPWPDSFPMVLLYQGKVLALMNGQYGTSDYNYVYEAPALGPDQQRVLQQWVVRNAVQSPFQGYEYGGFIRLQLLPSYLEPTLRMLEPPTGAQIQASQAAPLIYQASIKLLPGYYLVMGDNRTRGGSEDGRWFGAIKASEIDGRAILGIWPPSSWGSITPPAAFSKIPVRQ